MGVFGITAQEREIFNQLNQKLDHIIMKQSEATSKLESALQTFKKAKDEIMAELDKLRASDPDLSPEGTAAVQNLGNIAQAFDAIIADQQPEEESKAGKTTVRDHRYEK